MGRVRDYLSLIRFSHTVFALPFAVLAAVLAWRNVPFRWSDLVGVLLCMVTARSAAMAFNRLVDHRLDAVNPRTAERELPSGILSRQAVTGFFAGCSVAFVAATLLFLPNRLPLLLSVPVLAFLCGYSLAKRFTSFCHYWLGAALAVSPVAVWIALVGRVELTPLLLAAAIAAWVGGFDILYACQDEVHDREAGLHSIPAKLGRRGAFWVARVSHLVAAGLLFAVAVPAGLGGIYLAGVGLISVALLVEHLIVSPDDLRRVGVAFFQLNTVVSFGVLAAAVLDVWWA